MDEKIKLMKLSNTQFEEFLKLSEKTKWEVIWKNLELLETYITNTDDTLTNLARAFNTHSHEGKTISFMGINGLDQIEN